MYYPLYQITKSTPKQDEDDKSFFKLQIADDKSVAAMGEEFDPNNFTLSLTEMILYLQIGIMESINLVKSVPLSGLNMEMLGSYYCFFETEFIEGCDQMMKDDNNKLQLPIEYVVGKLVCGMWNAKYCWRTSK